MNQADSQGIDARVVAEGEVEDFDLPDDVTRAIDGAFDRKARDVLCLDLRGLSSATDYFLVMTGTSDLHVRAIAEHLMQRLETAGSRPNHVEGLQGGRWVLIDYIDFVAHVFHPAARHFYQLERLWGDAPAYAFEN